MTELEWAARHIHEWAENDNLKAHICADGESFIFALGCPDECGISKTEWQAERARLQNKPKWDRHDWPMIVQNDNGDWWGMIGEPSPGERSGIWIQRDQFAAKLPVKLTEGGEVLGSWMDTLERRPYCMGENCKATPENGFNHSPECQREHEESCGVYVDMSADTSAHVNTAKSKYHRQIAPGVWVDVYDVIEAFGVTCPAIQHLIKKALAPGKRGHKDTEQDLRDIIVSADRALELHQRREALNGEAEEA